MSDPIAPEKKITSRLIDFLNESKESINWHRSCWKGGRDYNEKSLSDCLDTDFSSTTYTAHLLQGEILLEYHIKWEKHLSWFCMRFTKWARIGLNPPPEDIVLFSHNPYTEEQETKGHLPIFQARYKVLFVRNFDEAKVAMQDFADNGGKLAEYFINMSAESLREYHSLTKRFQEFRDTEEVVRIEG